MLGFKKKLHKSVLVLAIFCCAFWIYFYYVSTDEEIVKKSYLNRKPNLNYFAISANANQTHFIGKSTEVTAKLWMVLGGRRETSSTLGGKV